MRKLKFILLLLLAAVLLASCGKNKAETENNTPFVEFDEPASETEIKTEADTESLPIINPVMTDTEKQTTSETEDFEKKETEEKDTQAKESEAKESEGKGNGNKEPDSKQEAENTTENNSEEVVELPFVPAK